MALGPWDVHLWGQFPNKGTGQPLTFPFLRTALCVHLLTMGVRIKPWEAMHHQVGPFSVRVCRMRVHGHTLSKEEGEGNWGHMRVRP